MPDPGDLFAQAEELLQAAAEALDTIPDYLGSGFLGAPERQFISPGLPVADCCEMLTVWVDPLGEGARTRQTLAATVRINRPTLNLLALRCIPTGKVQGKTYIPPSTAELNAASEQHLADGWALWNHLFNMVIEGFLFEACHDLAWNPGLSQTPSGGCGGWRLGFSVGLDGYPEDLTT